MLKVYEDFGDLRYEGDRYVAFKQWWTERVNTNEQRGVYLFAEPPHTASVSVIQAVDEAAAALSSEDTVLIAVNVTRQRKHIDSRIERILKKHMGELKRGRQVRNPKLSAARYRLSKAVQAQTLKKTFTVYDIRTAAEAEGRRVSNWEVAQQAKLDYRPHDKGLDVYDETAVKRVVSAIVARHMKDARTIIENAAVGRFP
jgi:anaerobic ribonucleoside-triphosphate reductase